VAPIDDEELSKAVPFDWESVAPLRGLAQQPESVQRLLVRAAAEAKKEGALAEAARRRLIEAERKAALQREVEEKAAAAAAAVEREKELQRMREAQTRERQAMSEGRIAKVHDIFIKDGVKFVAVELNNKSVVNLKRTDERFSRGGHERQLVLDFEATVRARAAGSRIRKGQQWTDQGEGGGIVK